MGNYGDMQQATSSQVVGSKTVRQIRRLWHFSSLFGGFVIAAPTQLAGLKMLSQRSDVMRPWGQMVRTDVILGGKGDA